MSLSLVRDDLNLETAAPGTTTADLASTDPRVDQVLDVALQSPPEILVQRAAAGEDNVLVQTAPDIDRALLDDAIHDDGERREEIGGVDLGIEEYLGRQEPLVTDVDTDLTSAGLPDDVLREAAAVPVETGELLHDIWAYIAVLLLDLLGRLQGAVGLTPVSEQRLYEVGDISTGDGDRLDGRADDVTFSYGDDVCDTIARVDDGTG